MRGLFHIYTGEGKGKTTAALGLALRAYGRGLKILYCQFLKSGNSGEFEGLALLKEGLTILNPPPIKGFLANMSPEEQEKVYQEQRQFFYEVAEQAGRGGYDLVILDEIIHVLNKGILSEEQVCTFIKERPEKMELVFTGRGTSEKLIELADYVSEVVKVKHPYDQGVGMRKGIEY